MMNQNTPVIIGIDHGYGNVKTRNCCFPTGVLAFDKEPTFKQNLLIYEGRYYLIGEGHKEFTAEKMADSDFYILTLAAIARELQIRSLTSARVHIAAGLPLTWVSEQKDAFRQYLLQNESADFVFRGIEYHVDFAGADIFPQGFPAVVDSLRDFKGVNMLADIGNGTMNIMYVNNRKPVPGKCFTDKYGVHQCVLTVREKLMQTFGTVVDDLIIEDVLRYGDAADVSQRYLDTIITGAKEYTEGIMRRLREREYNPELMRLYVMGGGSCLIRNFADYDKERVTIISDIRATAKGYETLSEHKLRRDKGGLV